VAVWGVGVCEDIHQVDGTIQTALWDAVWRRRGMFRWGRAFTTVMEMVVGVAETWPRRTTSACYHQPPSEATGVAHRLEQSDIRCL
jgi:hypothetical protein